MSGAGQDGEIGAMEIGLCAATWLERRHHDAWSTEDQTALDEWLAQSLTHRIAYLRLEDAWLYADRLSALKTSPRPSLQAVGGKRTILGATAAAIVAIVLGAGALTFFSGPREQIYATAIGGHRHVMLDDGSQVELNTDTVMHIANGGDRRIVTLDRGEAYFQITHDAKRPFVVIAEGRRLIDLGTKFLVREDANRLRVSVFDGRVQFDPANRSPNASAALLTSGDVLVATADGQSVQKKSTVALAKDLGWRQGVITLDNATLASAAAEFNRYNERKLVIADPKAAQLRIVGTFRADNVDAFASVAQDIFGLRVENRNTEVVISR